MSSLAEIAQCETCATTLQPPSALTTLLSALAATPKAGLSAALTHALRRVFTALFAAGRVGSGDAVSRWVSESFGSFLELLARALSHSRVDARVLALSTIVHFFAAAAPPERAVGAPRALAFDVVLWFVRTLVAARGERGAQLASVAVAFRSEFVDEYDDLRLTTLRALRDAVTAVAATPAASASATARKRARGDAAAAAPAGDVFSRAREQVASAPSDVIARNCVNLLLAISLPLTQSEWDGAPHAAWSDEVAGVPTPTPAPAPAASGARFAAADSDDEFGGGIVLGDVKSAPPAAAPVRKEFQFATARRAFAEAWNAALRLPLPPDSLRRVLLALPKRILPALTSTAALSFADFLLAATERGGATALLALEALFSLSQQHGLAVPRFYARVYALLGDASTPYARFRTRFFALLDLVMSSVALPSYLVAAFAKRAARVSLTAPVGVALWALPFVYNLVKRHPVLLPLLHRERGNDGASASRGSDEGWPARADPFDADEADPAKANALASSLWEITALAQHTFAPVAHAARLLMAPPSRGEFDLSEGAAAGHANAYADLTSAELTRVVKGSGGTTTRAAVVFDFATDDGGSSQLLDDVVRLI